MKKYLIMLLTLLCFFTPVFAAGDSFMNENVDVRLENFLAKIRRGEEVTVLALGGSITTGFAAKNPSADGWAGLTGAWIKKLGAENKAKVNYYNRGVSGTDSAFAIARFDNHVAALKPDLVLFEYAMNDQWLDTKVRKRTYEAIVRRLLSDSDCAILALFVNERKAPYPSNQAEQQKICEYYHIPYVSWKDSVKKNGSLSDFEKYFDGQEGIHPNNTGHAKIAEFMEERINQVWKVLPEDSKIASPCKELPAAMTDCGFVNSKYYGCENLKPLANTSWKAGSPAHNEWISHGNVVKGWECNEGGAEITFEVEGSSVGITYCESDQFRDAQAWVTKADGSNGPKVNLNCYVSYRKGYYGWAYRQLIDGDKVEKYTVHVVVSKRVARGGEKKFCNITGILVAGEK
ncbi:MAG: SGNH/GDSL hydrolase family protein [Treponema sp.]|nr:SGNH/GDSL hydrolase family protein [Treponema sp.]